MKRNNPLGRSSSLSLKGDVSVPKLGLTGFALTACVFISLVACGSGSDVSPSNGSTTQVTTEQVSVQSVAIPEGAVEVLNKDLGGSGEYEFSPKDHTFSVGDQITFAISAETEFHTFTVDELEIDVEIDAGETEIFTFTFDKAGTYKLICIPHESLGMVGEIIVQ